MSPSYDFGCTKCEHTWETFLPLAKMDEPFDEPCPNCGETGCIHRFMGAPVVHWSFMGSTIQSSKHCPDTFKDVLRRVNASTGGKAKNIEV